MAEFKRIITEHIGIFIQEILNKNPKTYEEYFEIWNTLESENNIVFCSYIKKKGKTRGDKCTARAVDGEFCQLHKKYENFQHEHISLNNGIIDHKKENEELMRTLEPNIKLNQDFSKYFQDNELTDILNEIEN